MAHPAGVHGGPHLLQQVLSEEPAAQQGLVEAGKIGGGGHHCAGRPRPRRVHLGDVDQPGRAVAHLPILVGWGIAPDMRAGKCPLGGWQLGVVEAQRLEDALLELVGERLAGGPLHDQAGQDVVGVAVGELRPGSEQRLVAGGDGDQLLGRKRRGGSGRSSV